MEVLVVADGCTDETVAMLSERRYPFRLCVIEQPGQGPAAARNRGAAQALGRILLFLDDDVEPTVSLVEAHVKGHQRGPDCVFLGPYPPVHQGSSYFHLELQGWWGNVFWRMTQPGYRFLYSDLLSGNLSIGADLFARIGGFDPALRVHEDYELGMRLVKMAVQFKVVPEGLGYHHDKRDLQGMLARKRQEGKADVLLARRHPEFARTLPLAEINARGLPLSHIFRFFAFRSPRVGAVSSACIIHLLRALEAGGLRTHWRRIFKILLDYWYWRGVAKEIGTQQRLADLVSTEHSVKGNQISTIVLDLGEGLEVAERRLDKERPAGVRIRYGQHIVGVIQPCLGAEALRGAHLRPLLARDFAVPLIRALALEGLITKSSSDVRLRLSQSIGLKWDWFGPIDPNKMWFEQYSQWKALENSESEKNRLLREHWDLFRELQIETIWLEAEQSAWQHKAGELEGEISAQ
jgi:GT2 family glycosyltransferase